MNRYVTIKKCSDLTGYSVPAIEGKIRDGVWLENRIWVKAPDGRTLINMEAYDLWAESRANTMGFVPPQTPQSKSTSTTQAKGAKNGSSVSPRLPT